MNYSKQIFKYIMADLIASMVGWLLFNIFRYEVLAYTVFSSLREFLSHKPVVEGQLFAPLLWLLFFYLSGYYNKPFLKSRFEELRTTLLSILVGALFFFFAIVLDDIPLSSADYFKMILALVSVEFGLVYLFRYLITQKATRKIHAGEWAFNTLVLGSGLEAQTLVDELNQMKQKQGFRVLGFLNPEGNKAEVKMKVLGDLADLDKLIVTLKIQKLIIAPQTHHTNELYTLIHQLLPYALPISMKADLHDILMGKIKMSSIHNTPMLEINASPLNDAQTNCKRAGDLLIAGVALLLLVPLFIILTILVRCDSKGPAIYSQERIGKFGKPFQIYKFRTMYLDAEQHGPGLSKVNDARITAIGKFLRKYRLDELPQFWNVIIGDMSLVGPRPERKFFIDRILKQAPYYCLIHRVQPGITSWGMVKFGYASDIPQMINRLKYDILYLENMSLAVDCKILIYTIKTVLTGKGI